jgi:cyclase
MDIPRIIPCLLLAGRSLVKPVRFRRTHYIGDPFNTVRIFNDREVDEIVFLDILASESGAGPQFGLIEEIASECFIPFAYGGGITSVREAVEVIGRGAEKVVVNSAALRRPGLLGEIAAEIGSQSVMASIDVRRNLFGAPRVRARRGRRRTGWRPADFAREAELCGAGEILLTSIDRDGTFSGYDHDLVCQVTSCTTIPVIACGGASGLEDMRRVVRRSGAAAAASGSLFVYRNSNRGVLINYPDRAILEELFA